jgi:pheromone shutdown protein TraB
MSEKVLGQEEQDALKLELTNTEKEGATAKRSTLTTSENMWAGLYTARLIYLVAGLIILIISIAITISDILASDFMHFLFTGRMTGGTGSLIVEGLPHSSLVGGLISLGLLLLLISWLCTLAANKHFEKQSKDIERGEGNDNG